MARRKAATKRVILPDPLFESELIAKFINVVMRCGKKAVAEKVVYDAFERVLTRVRRKGKTAAESKEGEEEGGEGKAGAGGIRNSEAARKTALELFVKVLGTIRPTVEVKSRRVGGATYQIPMEVNDERGKALAMRWLTENAKKRGERGMALRLAGEILDALEGKGGSVKKREDMHRMAKANQAFAHYRW